MAADVVAKYIHDKAISKVELTLTDVQRVLDLGVLDRKLEKRHPNQYRARLVQPPISPLVTVPCFRCPMAWECRPGHRISPETCEYMRDFFDI